MNFNWMQHLPAWIRGRIEGREQLQQILSNITWLSLDKLLRMGVGLVVGVWVARYLGAERFGQLNFAQAFVVLFSPLALLGLDSIAIRDLVSKPDQQNTTLGTCFALRFAGGIVALVVAITVMFFLRPNDELTQVLVVIAGAAFLFQTFDVIDFWFQARVQSKFVVYARNFAFLCSAIVKVVLILMQASLLAFAWTALAEIALGSFGLIFFYKRQNIRHWKPQIRRAKELLRESWPLFLAGISIAIYMKIDQVMLGSLLDNKQVGIYSVAIKMVEIWYFIPMAIVSSVFPTLIKARAENKEMYRLRLQILYDTMSVIAFAIAIVTSLFSEAIILLLYGNEYAGAAPILSIYAWASIPISLNVASSQHLVIENRTRVLLSRTFAGGIVNVVLNLFLIPRYGGVGAATATLISYITATFFLVSDKDLLAQAMMMIRSLNPLRWLRYSEKMSTW